MFKLADPKSIVTINTSLNYLFGLGVIALAISIFVTLLIGRQVEKYLSRRAASRVFLFIAIIPGYQIIQIIVTMKKFWRQPFLSLWLVFALFCLAMYVAKKNRSE